MDDFLIEAVIHDLVPGELAFPKMTYGLAVSFLLRRCELERLRWKDLTWDEVKLTIYIRKSKTDQAGKGVRRTLGCTCLWSTTTCPVELVKKLAKAVDKALPGHRSNSGWVACSSEGRQVVKEKLVAAWSRAAGAKLRGHSARRSGAMFYVRAGLTIAEVTYLGRWHSDLVFQYGEEAWEGRPMNKCQGLRAEPEGSRTRALLAPDTTTPAAGADAELKVTPVDAENTQTLFMSGFSDGQAEMGDSVWEVKSGPPPGQPFGKLVSNLEDEVRLAICESQSLHALLESPQPEFRSAAVAG